MIRATFRTETATRNLDRFANKQLAFATALALTRTAQEFVAEETKLLPSVFHIRNGWVAKGFRVKPARKDDLVAVAYHRDDFMRDQEAGGDKTPRGGKKTVAVPVGARPNVMQTTPRSKWPRSLKRSFVITTKTGDVLLLQRTGRKVRRARGADGRFTTSSRKRLFKGLNYRAPGLRDRDVRLMYVLERSVRVPARWGFAKRAAPFMARRFAANLAGFLDYAARTAR